ncbi:MAG: MBL fold metallo-hydrolase, partial [Candidatus Jordarchaeales archaeon]
GDLGQVPSDEQVREIGDVDVLFIPVGGVYTIDAKEATETIKKVKAKVVVPMHYKVPKLNLNIGGVEEFVKGKENVKRIGGPEFDVEAGKLPGKTEIWVLSL